MPDLFQSILRATHFIYLATTEEDFAIKYLLYGKVFHPKVLKSILFLFADRQLIQYQTVSNISAFLKLRKFAVNIDSCYLTCPSEKLNASRKLTLRDLVPMKRDIMLGNWTSRVEKRSQQKQERCPEWKLPKVRLTDKLFDGERCYPSADTYVEKNDALQASKEEENYEGCGGCF